MSRRTGTQTPERGNAPTRREKDAPPTPAPDKQRVGERAFVRRERQAQRQRATRRRSVSSSSSTYGSLLLELRPDGVLRDMWSRIPRAALVCALVALLSAVCWSIVTPAFEVPDEPSHFAYVKQLAETGTLPHEKTGAYSFEEVATLEALRYYKVREQPQNRTIGSRFELGALEHVLAVTPTSSEKGSKAAGVATSEPPLYYALETVPYWIGSTLLSRLELMRLGSALLAALTALFAFMFLREALPRDRWAWSVGGLAVALTPLLGFMSGGVNPDALLFTVTTAVFYCLARAFRRGLSMRGACVLGGLMAAGFLTKLNFIGIAPGVVLGTILLCMRAARSSGRHTAYRMLALALGIGFLPVLLYVLINALSNHTLLGPAGAVSKNVHSSLLGELNYIWQLYLPRLPGTASDFAGMFPAKTLWFNGYVGLLGWLDTTFPGWVYEAALVPAAAIVALCARELLASHAALRARAPELAVYATMGVGLLLLIGAASYQAFPHVQAEFAQARYLLPLIALLGAVCALAARGAGRRWGPVVGALIVVLFLGHDIFSQLLVAGRYYG